MIDLLQGLFAWSIAAGLLAALIFVVAIAVVFWWNRKLD